MPQFTFHATDRMGNAIQGTVNATDEALAADQIQQMGYTPVQVRPLGGTGGGGPMLPASAPDPAAAMAAGSVAAPPVATAPRPAAIDLTQPVAEIPVTTNPLLAPLEKETGEIAPLQPWQRGGPVAPPPAPQTMTQQSVSLNQTQAMSPTIGTRLSSVERLEALRGVQRGIPYGPGVERKVSLFRRFQETMIFPIFSGVVVKDLAPFYRQFATLINAGLPLHQALVALESNTENRKLKEIARLGQQQVLAGGKFSDVMAAHPWIFQPMQIELVRAAEQGGMLDRTLLQIADYVEHELEIRRLISRETLYPKFVIFVAIMILGKPGFLGGMPAIAKLVVGSMGKLEEVYTGWNYLMDTVGLALQMLVPILALVALCRLFLFNIKPVREGYDHVKMAIPVLGKLVRQFSIAKFARTFAALYRGGFSMSTALQISGDACGNAVLRDAAHRAIPVAENGGLVSEALNRSGAFSPIAVDLFRTGETSGNLDDMLDKVADFHENEARSKSHMAAVAFGVLVFLVVALLVGRAIIGQYMGYASGISSAADGG